MLEVGLLMSQSAFAGYGLEACHLYSIVLFLTRRNPLSLDMGWKGSICRPGLCKVGVAIRFRWIWVGSKENAGHADFASLSQSAFAGYGLEAGQKFKPYQFRRGVAIRFRWIWVGSH